MAIENDAPRPAVRSPGEATAIVFDTAFGWIGAVAQDESLIAVSLPMPSRGAAVSACSVEPGLARPHGVLDFLAEDLRRHLGGERVELGRYPVDVSRCPEFHRRALLAARDIPCGQVRSYGWVALRAGRPGGARAAGRAMSRNPIALVIPCHRVVAARGRLGGFGGGKEMKQALLELEGIAFDGDDLVAERLR